MFAMKWYDIYKTLETFKMYFLGFSFHLQRRFYTSDVYSKSHQKAIHFNPSPPTQGEELHLRLAIRHIRGIISAMQRKDNRNLMCNYVSTRGLL